ncbi:hypothetical protein MIZ01_0781 [Sideroxyarcus emersonii]|uniref:Uncharacterized protein n=1 Tax=Sideroxyarcus emersonii TaxID=2764705 RepID=A0AAN1X8S1_9PROT|nr:hypothetical protein MIZ01_0781 [Sideroxyarcus emersonii]
MAGIARDGSADGTIAETASLPVQAVKGWLPDTPASAYAMVASGYGPDLTRRLITWTNGAALP